MTAHMFGLPDYERGLALSRQFGDSHAFYALQAHQPHADHCGAWEVLAWPCRVARDLLARYICEHDGHDRPCHAHDGMGARR